MTEPARRKPKLTLKDLKSVSLPEGGGSTETEGPTSAADFLASLGPATPPSAAPPAPLSASPLTPPSASPFVSEAAGDGPSIDAAEYLPEGVSSDVASLLGRPTKQQAETNAFRKLAEQVAAAEASAADERRRREEAEQRDRQLAADREALQRQIAETARLEQLRQARLRRRNRIIGGTVGSLILLLLAAVGTLLAIRPPPLDPSIYLARDVSLQSPLQSGESIVRFDAIPEPPAPETSTVEPTRRTGGTSGRTGGVRRTPPAGGRDTVRGRDLF
jgi:hypothetical protein